MSDLTPWGMGAKKDGPYDRVCVFAGGKVHVVRREDLDPDAAALTGGWHRMTAEFRQRPLEIYGMNPITTSNLSEATIAFGNAEGLR